MTIQKPQDRVSAGIDESPPDALLPQVGLDEERVELRTAVGAPHDSGKTNVFSCRAIDFINTTTPD